MFTEVRVCQFLLNELDACIKAYGAEPTNALRQRVVNNLICMSSASKCRKAIRETISDKKKRDKEDFKRTAALMDKIFQGLRP
jgi:hypothetical protein